MRHRKVGKIHDRPRGPRQALQRSLIRALIINRRIRTTRARAKETASTVDRLLHVAKKSNLTARRQLISLTGNADLAARFLATASEYSTGFSIRQTPLTPRIGDGAHMVLLELEPKKP